MKGIVMDESRDTIRFEIDGEWKASEMGSFLSVVDDLYNLRLALQVFREDWQDYEHFYMEMMHCPPFRRSLKRRFSHPAMWMSFYASASTPQLLNSIELSRITDTIYPHERLVVKRMEYASPGQGDLTGLGQIVGHIKEFSQFLIQHFADRKARKLRDTEAELRNQSLRIENARNLVGLAKDIGYTETEIRQMINWVDDKQQSLLELIENGKIRRVLLLSEQPE